MRKLDEILNEAFSREQRKDLIELFSLLYADDVAYAVAGGVAVAYWVIGRTATKGDIDIVIEEGHFEDIVKFLYDRDWSVTSGGGVITGGLIERFFISGERGGIKVDVLIVKDGLFFDNWREWVKWEGVNVAVLRPMWLVQFKYDSGRDKDNEDLIQLLRVMNDEEIKKTEYMALEFFGKDAWKEIELLIKEKELQ